ncbi:MAG: hypothetical protein ABSD87_12055 [Candidatus Acidiferrales bacterium]|jgi:hypothetical protein
MTCPQCQQPIPAKSLWTTSGFSGIICPGCSASLTPKPLTAILLFVMSIGLGDLALVLLRKNGAGLLLAFVGFFLVTAAVFALAAPLVLQMRPKDHGPSGSSAHRVA